VDPFVVIASAPTGAEATEVQIAKQGTFKDPRYGVFSITQSDFDSWVRNFMARNADEGLPVDVDHSPEKKGETEAVGWVKALEQRGKELWAKVEWNTLGQQLLTDRRYKFISPTYHPNEVDERGQKIGTALRGVALTNRPFLSMRAVSLSKDLPFGEEISATSDSPAQMNPELLKALGLEEDADEAKVLSAVTDLKAKAEAEPDEDTRTLEQRAKEEGKLVVTATTLETLTTQAQAGVTALAQLADLKFESEFKAALDAGRATPAQKDGLKTLYDVKPDETIKLMQDAPTVVNTEAKGSGGDDGTVPQSVRKEFSLEGDYEIDEEGLERHNKAVALAAEKNIDYVDAYRMVAV
jgi:phage I-like protein